jgi:hypothetical protein
MKKFLIPSLVFVLMAASCGNKAAETPTAPATTTEAAKPAVDLSVAPAFNTNKNSFDEIMVMSQLSDLHKKLDPKVQKRMGKNDKVGAQNFGGASMDKVVADVIAHRFLDGSDYSEGGIIYNNAKIRTIGLTKGELTSCSCYDIKVDAKEDVFTSMKTGESILSFLFDAEKKKWVAIKPDDRMPSIEAQKLLFEECKQQAAIIKDLTAKAK